MNFMLHLTTVDPTTCSLLREICGRGKKKDFFDVYDSLQLYKKRNTC